MRFATIAFFFLACPSCQGLSINSRVSVQKSRHATARRYANDDYNGLEAIKRSLPRRAMPHITVSKAEEAIKAGYIIRRNHVFDEVSVRRRSDGSDKKVRPLRVIRRIILRGGGRRDKLSSIKSPQVMDEPTLHDHAFDELTEEVTINLRYGSKNDQSAAFNSDRAVPNRVTFKSTRQASHSLQGLSPRSSASLTEYMTQPVEQYSLLSFHDEEPANDSTNLKMRRWLVRRLTGSEAQRYMNRPDQQAAPKNADNLFRLAVPLLPLIGWDLTPVIDLEVIPPKTDSNLQASCDAAGYDPNETYESKWAPLKGIRERVRRNQESADSLPVVKIKSLSVSLLSTQEEVHAAMHAKASNKSRHHSTSQMQEEAIGMVGKIEEWLKPHITFEAELSWNDEAMNTSSDSNVPSTVTAKATAITSLTIPKIPSGILRAAVPSAFLVKRLGATLTSKALEICLPRFLKQLDRDYKRWSGVDESISHKVKL